MAGHCAAPIAESEIRNVVLATLRSIATEVEALHAALDLGLVLKEEDSHVEETRRLQVAFVPLTGSAEDWTTRTS